MKHLGLVCAAVAALVVGSTAARAAPITGGISFGGGADPECSGGGTCNWATATGVDFAPAPSAAVAPGSQSGAYAGVPSMTAVTFTDFSFSPSLSPNPVSPLWTFMSGGNTYSFTLSSVVFDQGVSGPLGNSFLNLSGTGTLFITGFDATPGQFTFSGQEAGPAVTFSFSASSAATGRAAEPASLLLFGLAALGAGARLRRRR